MGTARTCDARCHDATGAKCACWCGGRYHGKGSVEARRLFLEDCESAGLELPDELSFIGRQEQQQDLFDHRSK